MERKLVDFGPLDREFGTKESYRDSLSHRRGIFHALVAIEEMAGADRDCASPLSGSETIPTRYGRASESSMLASSELSRTPHLSPLMSNSTGIGYGIVNQEQLRS
jgi:hypothetical protein